MFVPPKNEAKNNKKNKKCVPKKILVKQITEIKQFKTAGYLDAKDQDKIK